MAKQGLFLKINEVIDDPNMEIPVANSFSFNVRREGTGSGVSALPLTSSADIDVRAIGCEFYSDAGATVSLGQSHVMTAGVGVIYIKATASSGRVICRSADKILTLGNTTSAFAVGQTGNTANSPYFILQLDKFPTNLTSYGANNGRTIYEGNFRIFTDRCTSLSSLALGSSYTSNAQYMSDIYGDMTGSIAMQKWGIFSTSGLHIKDSSKLIFTTASLGATFNVINIGYFSGDVKDIPARLTSLELQPDSMVSGLYGDLKNTPQNLQYISFPQSLLNPAITYSGGKTWRTDMALLNLNAVPLDSSTIDLLLSELAPLSWTGNKSITLRGTRTSASDAYVNALQAKGVTITINP